MAAEALHSRASAHPEWPRRLLPWRSTAYGPSGRYRV